MTTTGIAVVGFGTVGTGVVRLLLEDAPRGYSERLERTTGCRLMLRHVCDVDLKRSRGVAVPPALLTDQVDRVLADPEVGIVVETVGGTTFAVDLMKRALAAGKDVVTANKAALAKRGPELFAAAREAGRSISFEASCAAGIPIIRAIRDGLVANRLTGVTGILNGTCNYILTQMSSTGARYEDALAEAQAKGYAEADPTLDVSGGDAGHKLAILAGLAFGADVRLDDLYVEGISAVGAADIAYATQLGYVVKLLAIGQMEGGTMSLRVHPTFVPKSNPLAHVSGVDNGVLVTGHAVGNTFYVGPGAGEMPTASSIVADVVDAAIGRARLTFASMAWLAGRREAAQMLPMSDIWTRYYMRFDVMDQPGVLASIAAVLGRHKISVASVLQHEPTRPESVPLVITTHDVREGNVAAALEEIRELPTVAAPAIRIRMLPSTREVPA